MCALLCFEKIRVKVRTRRKYLHTLFKINKWFQQLWLDPLKIIFKFKKQTFRIHIYKAVKKITLRLYVYSYMVYMSIESSPGWAKMLNDSKVVTTGRLASSLNLVIMLFSQTVLNSRNSLFKPVLRIHSILMRIRILDPHWKKMDPGDFFKIYWIFFSKK